jgi:hypothetical protein
MANSSQLVAWSWLSLTSARRNRVAAGGAIQLKGCHIGEEAKRVPTKQPKIQAYAYPGLVDRYGDFGSRLWRFIAPCPNRIITSTHKHSCGHSA